MVHIKHDNVFELPPKTELPHAIELPPEIDTRKTVQMQMATSNKQELTPIIQKLYVT